MFNLDTYNELNEAVINYDISELGIIIQESDSQINNALSKYRNIHTTLMNENANEIDLAVFTEAANVSMKDKFLSIIKSIRDFIMHRINEITAMLLSFFKNNTAFMDKVEDSLKKRLSYGDFKKGPIMNMYKYSLDTVNISNPKEILNITLKGTFYDFTLNSANINPENMAKIKDSVKNYSDNVFEGNIKRKVVTHALRSLGVKESMFNEAMPGMYDDIIYRALRGTAIVGNILTKIPVKFPVKFDANMLNEIKRGEDIKKYITGSFNIIMQELDIVKKETETALSKETGDVIHSAGKLHISHTDVFGPLHQYFNKKISIINTVIHTVTMLNMKKLQASVSYINDCKKLCLMAFSYPTELKTLPKGVRLPGPVTESVDEDIEDLDLKCEW